MRTKIHTYCRIIVFVLIFAILFCIAFPSASVLAKDTDAQKKFLWMV